MDTLSFSSAQAPVGKGELAVTPNEWKRLEEQLMQLSGHERLWVIEHLARSLREEKARSSEQQRAALKELRRELARLPVANPEDGFSNRDHDRLLYGDGR